ncbi:dTDP-4-dehydrorhamnose reductase family protein [Enterocloster aldenensis]|uniref:dTDP-4-dehydrorhamnose reductase family protein n=1 Tax=Enterocloster aldenensis TaxID=358742 RepID=UPI00402A435B
MKFLILGCNGMAGHMISLYLKERGHDVTGFGRNESSLIKCIVGDATDTDFLSITVGKNKFDSIINCIGILNQNAEDNKSKAVYLNSFLPHLLADITSRTNTQIIHMSTDCVFSGKRGQYTESDLRDGESFYDRTKALGELDDNKNITLRNSIIGPDINPKGIGLLNWFMQQKDLVNGYTRAIWTGQTTLQLAKTMEFVAREKVHGLYNAVPEQSISKYELLRLFNHYMRNDTIIIRPDDKYAADKSLKRTHFEQSYVIPDYEQMVAELSAWIHNHKELYPHYFM